MAIYLSQATLKEAVDRLAISSASSSLGDYLIFKRAWKLTREQNPDAADNQVSVTTGTRSIPFVQAIDELSLRVPEKGSIHELESPYYVPFGSLRDTARGYRSQKFPSNGPSNTVAGWQSGGNQPISVIPGTSPKQFVFERRSEKELERFFTIKSSSTNFSGERPRLLDTSIWWFRFAELSEIFSKAITAESLVDVFIRELALTPIEVSALFSQEGLQEDPSLPGPGDGGTDLEAS